MFIPGILIHELGHLIMGLVSGYRLLYVEVFGLSLEKKDGAYGFKHMRKAALGQCLMYHEDLEKCPILLILGGMVFNLIFGSVLILLSLFGEDLYFAVKLYFLAEGLANMSLVLMNIFGSSVSDGRTLKEVLCSKKQARIYNGILLMYKYLYSGAGYKDIPDVVTLSMEELLKEGSPKEKRTGLEEEAYMLVKRSRNGFTGKGI